MPELARPGSLPEGSLDQAGQQRPGPGSGRSAVQLEELQQSRQLPGRDDPNKQCDEYPFASTWQAIGVDGKMQNNAWVPSLNASLRMVSSDHNQAAGRDLGAFYARYRVLPNATLEGGLQNRPGNAFFVRIRDGAPPTPSS
ncbi:hypothetical protein [Nonomuraea sp. NPDC049709]|uniref:NucA/NucB deoxyribonuclease domain-containing protein n=1 Tax=Nonomuraea sp. NPDC049709 TaxID=3154736 RepID=UPI003427E284